MDSITKNNSSHTDSKLDSESITIFVPLSGRQHIWNKFSNFLDNLQCNPKNIHLSLLDTSQSVEYGILVKEWLKNSKYSDFSYSKMTVGKKGLADIERATKERSTKVDVVQEVNKAMCQIYTFMKNTVSTQLVFIIEDDVIPESDALIRLYSSLAPDMVSVTGAYLRRYRNREILYSGKGFNNTPLKKGSGIEIIKANGFGCLLLRMGLIRQHVFIPNSTLSDYDGSFYERLDKSQKVAIDWNVICEHLIEDVEFEECSHPYESNVSESNFNQEAYLAYYPDVKDAIEKGIFENAYQHYKLFGKNEGRVGIPNEPFDEDYYLDLYPDVQEACESGMLSCGLDHYVYGGKEQRRHSRKQIQK